MPTKPLSPWEYLKEVYGHWVGLASGIFGIVATMVAFIVQSWAWVAFCTALIFAGLVAPYLALRDSRRKTIDAESALAQLTAGTKGIHAEIIEILGFIPTDRHCFQCLIRLRFLSEGGASISNFKAQLVDESETVLTHQMKILSHNGTAYANMNYTGHSGIGDPSFFGSDVDQENVPANNQALVGVIGVELEWCPFDNRDNVIAASNAKILFRFQEIGKPYGWKLACRIVGYEADPATPNGRNNMVCPTRFLLSSNQPIEKDSDW